MQCMRVPQLCATALGALDPAAAPTDQLQPDDITP
jgi:hypothetical protein